jgi:hypothetical protein
VAEWSIALVLKTRVPQGTVSSNLTASAEKSMNVSHELDNEFIIHSCEQVLRFTRVEHWNDLSEERKIQLGFNMGVVALGLKLSKEEGFLALWEAREGRISMQKFHDHLKSIILSHQVKVDETKIMRPF